MSYASLTADRAYDYATFSSDAEDRDAVSAELDGAAPADVLHFRMLARRHVDAARAEGLEPDAGLAAAAAVLPEEEPVDPIVARSGAAFPKVLEAVRAADGVEGREPLTGETDEKTDAADEPVDVKPPGTATVVDPDFVDPDRDDADRDVNPTAGSDSDSGSGPSAAAASSGDGKTTATTAPATTAPETPAVRPAKTKTAAVPPTGRKR